MNEPPDKTRPERDAELEREVRADRKFSLEEAIGRMAGGGLTKGASPLAGKREAEAAVEEYLRGHLADAGGVLGVVLLRRLRESDLLLGGSDRPLGVLAEGARRLLGSDYFLGELSREAAAEWARVSGERPRFGQPGGPPGPDLPYTTESVRDALCQLVEGLAPGGA
jgi:hypothetical protein